MKKFWCISAVLLSMAVAQSAQAIGRLSIELRPVNADVQKKTTDSTTGVVELVLENTGDEAIEIDKDQIPRAGRDGKLGAAVFVVADSTGAEAKYRGYLGDDFDDSLETEALAPGKKMVKQINLLANYEMKPGQVYTVSLRFPVRYLDRPRAKNKDASSEDLRSLLKSENVTPLQITVDQASVVESAAKASVSVITSGLAAACTTPQTDTFNAAKSKAQELAIGGYTFMQAQFSQTTENGVVYELFANPPRFVKWFNQYTSKYKAMEGPGTVDGMLRTAVNMNGVRIANMTPDCFCDTAIFDPAKTYAYVSFTETYVVHLCPNFFTAPLIPTVRDESSSAGTLLHEAVHFEDSFWPGSGLGTDGKGHYTGESEQNALDLAASNHANAAKNPNNFKLYSLNQSW